MFEIINKEMILKEIAKEANLDEIRTKTTANYKVANDLKTF